MREVNGGGSGESAKTSLKRGASPSRFFFPRTFLQLRLVGGIGDGKGQQAGGKGACGSYAEKSRPPGDKSGNTGSALGHGGIARPREQVDEGGSFGTPATTDFKTEHNQAAPTGVGELRELPVARGTASPQATTRSRL